MKLTLLLAALFSTLLTACPDSVEWVEEPDGPPKPPGDYCYSSANCSPGQTCTVELGECLADPTCPSCPVCTGTCVVVDPPPPGCYTDTDCPSGYDCVPDPNAPPMADVGICVPTQVTCTCDNAACGPGTHCVIDSSAETCLPVCVSNAGTCTGDVLCDALPPACPGDTVPGIMNGCYSGYCIPVAACPELPVVCSQLDEAACLGEASCAAVYDGQGCTCQDGICTCQSQSFAFCQDRALPVPEGMKIGTR